MRYSAELYAKAFLATLSGKTPDEERNVIRRFLEAIKKFGDSRNLGKILAAVERLAVKKAGGREVVLESAREIPASLRKELEAKFTSGDLIRERMNPALIAGIRILIDGEWMVDVSLKRRLEKLFIKA